MTRKHKQKLHRAAWSPEARAKRAATLAAKRAALASAPALVRAPGRRRKPHDAGPTGDAIVFLCQARDAIFAGTPRKLTRPELYALLALDALQGG